MKKLMLLFMCIILSSFVVAVPPITSEFVGNEGLSVQANFQDYYKVNEGAEIHIFVFNISNGEQLSDPEVSCAVELTNRNGTVMMEGIASVDGEHFHMSRTADIISEQGSYAVTVVCNTSEIAGYKTAFFEANSVGIGLTEPRAIIYVGSLGILVFLFVAIIISSFLLPASNTRDEEGVIMSITWLKYLRPVLYVVAWVLMLAILFITSNIALAYLGAEMVGQLLFTLFEIMFWITIPMTFLWFIWIFVSLMQDKELKKMIERGVEVGQI